MRAAVAVSQNFDDPLSGLQLRTHPDPEPRAGWTRIWLSHASLNPHDLWTLRGIGHPADKLPIVLGCDGAGVTDDGREVVIYPVLGDAARGGGDETLDPQRALLSETIDGTLADAILVPDELVVSRPASIAAADAACLGVVWATAYRMLFTRARVQPGDRVLVQGASGGVASAAISLALAAGARVYATARTERKRAFAEELGAVALPPGARLPEKVEVVVETIGEVTWQHSLRALRPGGMIVIAGATSGAMPPAELQRIFYQQLHIVGSTGSTRREFEALVRFLESTGVRPRREEIGFDDIPAGYQRLIDGDVLGKIVVALADRTA